MTCIATQEETIELVTGWLSGLASNINPYDKHYLAKIAVQWEIGVTEIEGDGLTMESFRRMSKLLISAEGRSKERVLDCGDDKDLNMYEGLKRIHDKMQLISIAQGINEGPKDCCPLCQDESC